MIRSEFVPLEQQECVPVSACALSQLSVAFVVWTGQFAIWFIKPSVAVRKSFLASHGVVSLSVHTILNTNLARGPILI